MARAGVWRVGGELVLLLLVLGCLGGALGLVLAGYRRPTAERPRVVTAAPALPAQPAKPPQPPPSRPPASDPEPEDPTQPVLARIAAAAAAERDAAELADRESASHVALRRRAEAERARWSHREMLARAQADERERRARRIEEETAALAGRRDVLARRRDALRRELEEARARAASPNSFAVTPYKGPSGTWRRPIVLDCDARGVTLRPDGPTIDRDEIGLGFGRSSPLTAVVRQAADRVEGSVAEDGAPVVPYLLFLVRPDGIRAYYEARTVLEGLGIAFGYELVGQDWRIDVPALDDSATAPGRLALGGASDPAATPFAGGLEKRGTTGMVPADGRGRPIMPGAGAARPPGIGTVAPLAREPGNRRAGAAGQPRAPLDAIPDGPPIPYVPDRRPGRGLSGDPELDGFVEIIPGRTRDRDSDAVGRDVGAGSSRREPNGDSGLPGRAASGAGGPGTPGGGAVTHQGRPVITPPQGPGRQAQGRPGDREDAAPPAGVGPAADSGPAWRGGGATSALRPGAGTADVGHGGGALGEDHTPPAHGDSAGRSGTTGAAPGQRGQAAHATGEPSGFAGGGSSNSAPAASANAPRAIPIPIPDLDGLGTNHLKPGASAEFGLPGSSSGPQRDPADILELPGGLLDRAEPGDWFDLILTCGPSGLTVQPGGYRVSLAALESGDLLVRRLRAIAAGRERASAAGTPRPRLRFVVEPGGARAYWLARRRTTFAGLEWPASLRVNETAVPSPFETSGGPR